MPENRHKFEEFKIIPSIQQCFKCHGFRHKAQNHTKKQKLCVVKLIHTKTVQTKTEKPQNVQAVVGPMSPITEAVLHTRIKLSGNMWSKIKFLMPPL